MLIGHCTVISKQEYRPNFLETDLREQEIIAESYLLHVHNVKYDTEMLKICLVVTTIRLALLKIVAARCTDKLV